MTMIPTYNLLHNHCTKQYNSVKFSKTFTGNQLRLMTNSRCDIVSFKMYFGYNKMCQALPTCAKFIIIDCRHMIFDVADSLNF